jgi:chromosome partitioning protein
MPVVVVDNPKGGVGKSTLATNVAGYYARQGHAVMLGDADRQQSSRLWLGLRPEAARPIHTWDISADLVVEPHPGRRPCGARYPRRADGLTGWRFNDVVKMTNKLRAFVDSLDLPVLGFLRDTQNYIHLAAQGLTLFGVAPRRVGKDLEQCAPICDWLRA